MKNVASKEGHRDAGHNGSIHAQTVKIALNSRAEEFVRSLFPAGKKNGSYWELGSIAGEAGKSFKICIAGPKIGLFSDFNDGASHGNNLVELFVQARAVPFAVALRECASWLGYNRSSQSFSIRRANRETVLQPGEIYEPTNDQCAAVTRMAQALANDPKRCRQWAEARGWKAETLRGLALEGYLGCHDGKLAFIYDTGVKVRWKRDGERIIRWAFGKPWIWRGAWLCFSQRVYLCEGETDAISLINAGAENEPGTVVVAIPSASSFSPEWALLFAGKDVILAFDSDDAGRKATDRVSQLLFPRVCKLEQLNWEGLQNAR